MRSSCRSAKGPLLGLSLALFAFAFALLLSSCSRSGGEAALGTGKVLERSSLPLKGWVGDEAYAEVRSAALPQMQELFRSHLSELGLVKWDARFDCNRFAALFIACAQARFAALSWHSETKAQGLALAEFWYRPAGKASGHAIVAAATERGLLFWEPQTGREVQLSSEEIRSAYLVKW